MYQIVAGNSPISLELQIITHDGDSGNTTTNSDLDLYVLDTEQNSVSQGAPCETEFCSVSKTYKSRSELVVVLPESPSWVMICSSKLIGELPATI